MKLDTTELMAGIAIILGAVQLLMNMKDVMTNDDISGYNFTSVLMGIVASSMWVLYQFRKGANYSGMYTSAGLVVQLYILHRLLVKSKELTKKDMHSKI